MTLRPIERGLSRNLSFKELRDELTDCVYWSQNGGSKGMLTWNLSSLVKTVRISEILIKTRILVKAVSYVVVFPWFTFQLSWPVRYVGGRNRSWEVWDGSAWQSPGKGELSATLPQLWLHSVFEMVICIQYYSIHARCVLLLCVAHWVSETIARRQPGRVIKLVTLHSFGRATLLLSSSSLRLVL